jgi:Raf kinase inhibitor-like YbhB/YbcL family protein
MSNRPYTLLAGLAAAVAIAGCAGGTSDAPSTTIGTTQGGGMELTSSAFRNDTRIPTEYTCDGDDTSPPLAIADIPPGTRSLTLIVEDPDAPAGTWYHWVAFDIPVVTSIPAAVAGLGTGGANSWGRTGYGGPCPPRGSHRYYFIVTALDTELALPAGSDQAVVRAAMDGHVLASATLVGHYSR